jgi:hypothetical protein
VDAARELAELVDREPELVAGLTQQLAGLTRIALDARLRQAQRQRERHEPLLGAVVEVAVDRTALVVGRVDHASA